MRCPSCAGTMVERHLGIHGDIEVDVCRECASMWLDPGELDRLDESVRTDAEGLTFDVLEAADGPPCPRCTGDAYRGEGAATLEHLAPVDAPDLVLRGCPRCLGFLVTPDELEAVRDLVLHLDSAQTEKVAVWHRLDTRASPTAQPAVERTRREPAPHPLVKRLRDLIGG